MTGDPPRPRHRWFAAAYERFIEPAGRKQLEPLRVFAAGGASGRVLEIGAGTGSNLAYYDWSKIESLDLTEPDPFMAQRLRPRVQSLPFETRARVRVHEAPAERLPFPDGYFDCAVVTLVLCTVSDLQLSLADLWRVLKPGGELRIVEHVRAKGFGRRLQAMVQPMYGWTAGGCRLDRQTEAEIRNAGFDLEVTQRPGWGPLHPAFAGIARRRDEPVRRPTPARTLHRRRRLLKRGVYLLDRRFLRQPERYALQAGLATLILGIVIAVEDALTNAAIITAIAATAFLMFMAPTSKLASPRRVIGGHSVGIIVGLTGAFVLQDVLGEAVSTRLVTDVVAALAVGIAMLVMAATDTEHPPGAGTVLGLVLAPHPMENGVLVILAAIILSAATRLFRPWLIDLIGAGGGR